MREESAITIAAVSSLAYSEQVAEVSGPRGLLSGVSVDGPRPALRLARPEEGDIPQLLQRAGLTPRDVTVLGFLAQGWTTSEIAHELVYAESTIKKEVHFIVHRLGARNRTHAVAMAIRESVI